MDAMDILGGLLGGKSGSGGLGGKILKDILTGGSKPSSAPSNIPKSDNPNRQPRRRGVDIDKQADALEDLLNVAKDRDSRRSGGANRKQSPTPSPSQRGGRNHGNRSRPGQDVPDAMDASGGFQFPVDSKSKQRPPVVDPYSSDHETQNQRALILVRAMINAAKADGRLTAAEQRGLFDYLGDTSKSAVQFLQDEFNQPLDVRQFAWDVPLGMEEQVYTMSIASIDLDLQKEANYLKELAHGLRLTPEICNAIHQRHHAPLIY